MFKRQHLFIITGIIKTKYWIVITVLTLGFLCSCSVQEILSNTAEFEAYKALQNAQKPKGSHLSTKERAEEAERLKQEGKCPSCRGFGKTPDGRFTCSVCNGTGKYLKQTKEEAVIPDEH